MPVQIRAETSQDADAIRAITELAFRDMPYASGDEHIIIDRLRAADALTVSLVATLDDRVVGHIAFSPAQCADSTGPWYTLGPVAVTPLMQRNGIGSALIWSGLKKIEDAGAPGCILVGNPDYYRRFGFKPAPANAPQKDLEPYFMLRRISTVEPDGPFRFHAAFSGA